MSGRPREERLTRDERLAREEPQARPRCIGDGPCGSCGSGGRYVRRM